MGIFITYFLLELKRSIRVFLKSFLLLCVAFALIGGCVFVLSHFLLEGQAFKVVDIGVVIPEDENDTKIAFRFGAATESVRSVSKFHYMDLDDAMEGLKSNELQGIIVIPQDFYANINNGINTPAEVYFSNDPSPNTRIFKELVVCMVSLLRISESGIYSMLNTADEFHSYVSQGEIGNTMAIEYAKILLKRDEAFDKYVLSPFGEYEVYQYYLATLFIIFMCMIGVNFSFMYKKQTKAIEEKLKIFSLGEIKLGIIKILVMTVMLWFAAVVICIGGYCLCGVFGAGYFMFDFRFLSGLILLCLSFAIYFHIIYSACNGGMQGVFTLLAFNGAMIICSGAVLPTVYLPKPAAAAGRFMPLGCWSEFAAGLAFGGGGVSLCYKLIGVIAIELLIGAVISWKNILYGIDCN